MAHIFDLAGQIDVPAYSDGKKSGTKVKFPSTPAFSGFNLPSRIEGDIFDLEFTGQIPPEINGTFYRIQPDHRFPPLFSDDIHFNGDGAVTAIRISNGHADFRHKYVRTERYIHETTARRSLFGRYRNPFTDHESVKGVIRTASNTNVTFWRGMLLASKEDGPPYAMDPITLETLGRYDFEGQIRTPTFTAHPKFDPETGEMICFAYEAGGDGHDASDDIVVWTIDADGNKTEECWYKAPFCGMIHDCGLSRNYVVLPLTPIKASLERLKNGGNHFAWDPTEDQWYGVVPRRGGKPEDIKWFRAPNAFHGHVAGCYEDPQTNHIIFDLTVADGNVFFFFPPDGETPQPPNKRNALKSPLTRWRFDPAAESGTRVEPAQVFETNGEFSRIDDRWVTKEYRDVWAAKVDPSKPYDFAKCGPPAGGLFNSLSHFRIDTQLEQTWFAGPTATIQEPSFIPREGGGEGDGWIIALLNHLDVLQNDIVILDAQDLPRGPVATVHLPLKLKLGLHGNFVAQREIEEFARRRGAGGDLGPVKIAEKPLLWQEKAAQQEEQQRRANGVNGNASGASDANGVGDGH